MVDESRPPPWQTLLSAAAGGFLGVLGASALLGAGDNANEHAANDAAETKTEVVEVIVAKR